MADQWLIDDLRAQIASIEAGSAALQEDYRGRPVAPSDFPKGEEAPEKGRAREHGGGVDGASPEAALSKIVALVNVSDRSELTIRERLARAGFEQPAIDEAVERAKSYGFIDDLRFAEVLVRSRIAQGRGSAGIERELAENDIDPAMVPGWPEGFDINSDTELDRALALLEKRPPRSKNLREGAYRKLVGKGYPSSVASSAARIWCGARQG